MTKFAKLFDVEDTQVLFMITTDDDDDVALKMITEVDDLEIGQTMAFKRMDQDKALGKAQEVLGALNQESAIKFHAQMVSLVSGSIPADADRVITGGASAQVG